MLLQCLNSLFYSLYQQTPLHFAAREGHDYTVKFLVKQGAKMNIKDIAGVSICEYSV